MKKPVIKENIEETYTVSDFKEEDENTHHTGGKKEHKRDEDDEDEEDPRMGGRQVRCQGQ
jgi:hypothetical protein